MNKALKVGDWLYFSHWYGEDWEGLIKHYSENFTKPFRILDIKKSEYGDNLLYKIDIPEKFFDTIKQQAFAWDGYWGGSYFDFTKVGPPKPKWPFDKKITEEDFWDLDINE